MRGPKVGQKTVNHDFKRASTVSIIHFSKKVLFQ